MDQQSLMAQLLAKGNVGATPIAPTLDSSAMQGLFGMQPQGLASMVGGGLGGAGGMPTGGFASMLGKPQGFMQMMGGAGGI